MSSKLYKHIILIVLHILISGVSATYAQNKFRLIKNNYFTESPTFPEFVATHKLKQVIENLDVMASYRFGDTEQDKIRLYTSIADELIFRREPLIAETLLQQFLTVKRTLILKRLQSEAADYFKNYTWK